MAAPRYSVLGLSLLALLLVTACSASIFGKDESKVGNQYLPLSTEADVCLVVQYPGAAHSAAAFRAHAG